MPPAHRSMIFFAVDRTEPLLALPGPWEWGPILLIVVLLFGAKKLPQLARAMGSSITQFRRGLDAPPEDDEEGTGAAAGDLPKPDAD